MKKTGTTGFSYKNGLLYKIVILTNSLEAIFPDGELQESSISIV